MACYIVSGGLRAFGANPPYALLKRNILHFIGIEPARATLYGMIATSTPEKRARWLETMRELGAKAQ